MRIMMYDKQDQRRCDRSLKAAVDFSSDSQTNLWQKGACVGSVWAVFPSFERTVSPPQGGETLRIGQLFKLLPDFTLGGRYE